MAYILIFCEMSFKYFDYSGRNRRPSSKGIGEKLGLDERTVRLRIRKMEREGFIQYYQAVPNLRLLGQPLAYLCNFQAADVTAKQRAISMFCEADDIIDIADYLGESFGVTVSARSEEDAQQTIKKLQAAVNLTFHSTLPIFAYALGAVD